MGVSKVCVECDTPKELRQFRKEPGRARRNTCIECFNRLRRERRASDPDKSRSYERKRWSRLSPAEKKERRRRRTPQRVMLYNAKSSSKSRGLEFSITLADIKIPKVCPVFGTPFVMGEYKRNPLSPSLDRIDNNKGYVPGNVAVISWRANSMKRASSISDLEALLSYMRSHG